ncbi:MAG: putative metal-binding motif-containing protein, partial [Myxococcota bacterium]
LAGCGFIPASEREWRLDPDLDGANWPDDCDDNDPTVLDGPPWFLDEDGDGYGGNVDVQYACEKPDGYYVRTGEDCDDADPLTFPGASEVCDEVDQNCDGEIDEGFPVFEVFFDADDDGYGGESAGEKCDAFPGYAWNEGDCNDEDPDAHPHAGERCNDQDDDCDEYVDEALVAVWYPDEDDDGFGDPAAGMETCAPPEGWVARGEDCDDTQYITYPYAVERCGDAMDNDCNGVVDDEVTRWMDSDGDGFGDPSTERTACDREQDEVDNYADCDDTDPYKNPAVPEVCDDGIDNDCDDIVDTCEGS